MNAIALGPFIISAGNAAAILGFMTLLAGGSLLARYWREAFSAWSSWVLLVTFVSARLGHVIENAGGFADAPWRALYFWQGGFSPLWAIPAVLAVTVWKLSGWRARAAGLALAAASAGVWAVSLAVLDRTDPVPLPDRVYERVGLPPVAVEPDGRPLVINLWATWCPPCVREMPMLAQAAADHDGARFIFANQGESEAVIRRFTLQHEVELEEILIDPGSSLMVHYGAVGLPVTLFIDAEGTLRQAHVGEISRERLDARLRAMGVRADP